LWGFQRLDVLVDEPLRSATILLGALVCAAGIGAAIVFTWRRNPSAIIVLEMVALGAVLASERAAFGLFKLAMFIQPFVLATFTLASLGLARRSRFWIAPMLAMALLGLQATLGYVAASRGQSSSVEVPNGSAARINDEFQQALAS